MFSPFDWFSPRFFSSGAITDLRLSIAVNLKWKILSSIYHVEFFISFSSVVITESTLWFDWTSSYVIASLIIDVSQCFLLRQKVKRCKNNILSMFSFVTRQISTKQSHLSHENSRRFELSLKLKHLKCFNLSSKAYRKYTIMMFSTFLWRFRIHINTTRDHFLSLLTFVCPSSLIKQRSRANVHATFHKSNFVMYVCRSFAEQVFTFHFFRLR